MLDELPTGFIVDPDATRVEVVMVTLADTAPVAAGGQQEHAANAQPAGVRFETELRREQIGDGVGEGPIVISQTITRIDGLLVPADVLAESRDTLIREGGFASVPGPLEEEGVVRLVKHTATDTIYTVGLLKHDTVVFTSVRGVEPAVDLDLVMALASRTSAKYDLLAARPLDPGSEMTSGIQGKILVHPSCPGIEIEGPECAPQPTQEIITVRSDVGEIITRFQTDEDGTFAIKVPPGVYMLEAETPGAFASADGQEVVVAMGQTAEVTLTYRTP